MQTALLLAVLAQVLAPQPPATVPSPGALTWSDGQRRFKLYESARHVAEPAPSDTQREALLRLEPTATVLVDTPTMRVWRVPDAKALRAKWPVLLPVLHDVPAGVGRLRVPLALVCDGRREVLPWRDVLARSGAACLPDFWYPPVRK